MQHIDEFKIELYVLNAPEVEAERETIHVHLGVCYFCGSLAQKMERFHSQLRDDLANLPETNESPSSALVRQSREIEPLYDSFSESIPFQPRTLGQRVLVGIIRHPVAVSLGGLGLAAALVGLGMLISLPVREHVNPLLDHAAYHENPDFIQGYNLDNVMLWQLAGRNLGPDHNYDLKYDSKYTQVADIDNDGTRELITSSLLEGDEHPWERKLRVYRSNKSLLWVDSFNCPFKYWDRRYSATFRAGPFILGDSDKNGRRTLLVSALSDNSPYYLARLDEMGKLLGRYWHFGPMNTLSLVKLGKGGQRVLMALGTNEANDTSHHEFGVMAILDPEKIVGQKKASAIAGFDFPLSDAELYYIRFPWSDMNVSLKAPLQPENVKLSDSLLTIEACSPLNQNNDPVFHFLFGFDLAVIDVKAGDHTGKLRDSLVKQGLLSGKLDRAYLQALGENVRYWDGREWRKEVCRVSTLDR